MKRPIVLMTDFGASSYYTGVMKGVILSVDPDAVIVDLTHEIAHGDIIEASCIFAESFRFFPAGTIFVVVVDPGVGSERKILAVDFDGKILIAPDNGFVGIFLSETRFEKSKIFHVTNQNLFLADVSATFHGRDIFSPVAAWISCGVTPEITGPEIFFSDIEQLPFPKAVAGCDGSVTGEISRIDRFGNLVTNIHKSMITCRPDSCIISIEKADLKLCGLSGFYSQGTAREPVALISSGGWLEIAVNMGKADDILGLARGDKIVVTSQAMIS